ncbi:DUF6484 domain-containing protein [Pseudorhodoferax soli]|uniref:DUF6484 domain-containing protein n=1 Tax=Pseudorhodoferax soli TaxID=545864 RepID=A0A368Y637_9BURK|nr:DUF6484 domain-containing protein [Pseudorhodoferax soli]RCW75743.1 hypothetical protein DES41_101338 [Pseudorhodoferax soli]
MDRAHDPFLQLAMPDASEDLCATAMRGAAASTVAVARLAGFDLWEQALVGGIAARPGLVMAARSTVALQHAMVGLDVVVLLAEADTDPPIIIGVIAPAAAPATPHDGGMAVVADGERHVIEAEREIVLRCGDASITLTRAGKIIVQGNYILSRSTGHHKIKGAAIDIN